MWVILQLSNLILKNATQACKKKDTVLRRRSYPAGCFTLLSLGYWPVTNQFQMHLRKYSAMQDASVVSANPGPSQSKKGNIWFSEVSRNVFNCSLEGSIPEQEEHLSYVLGTVLDTESFRLGMKMLVWN